MFVLPRFLFFFIFIIISLSTLAQTPGLIFKPAAGAGRAVLDPNGDGYTSASTSGFTTDDKTQSEIPFVPLVFPMLEPTGDLGPGPDCSFTDFVDSGTEDPSLTYFGGVVLAGSFDGSAGGVAAANVRFIYSLNSSSDSGVG